MTSAARAVWIALIALMMASCAPVQPRSTWIAPGTTPRVYRDLLVLGVAPNPRVRRAYEDNFVELLTGAGVQARAAHTLVSDQTLARSGALQKAAKRSGADGILITHLAGSDMAPGEKRSHVIPVVHGPLQIYYDRIFRQVTSNGYYKSFEALTLETNLYDIKQGTLLWSTRSESLDPTSEQTMISEVIDAQIDLLRADGFLPGPAGTTGAGAGPGASARTSTTLGTE